MALAGPATGSLSWLSQLPGLQTREPGLRQVTYHRYPLNRCVRNPRSPLYPSVPHLLSRASSAGLVAGMARWVTLAHRHGEAFRVDELGAVTCGGMPGVSDTFASALWTLDTAFWMARTGVDGVDVHVHPEAPANQLFTFTRAHDRWTGAVRPQYYGLLLFAQAAPPGARLLRLAGAGSGALRAWATLGRDRRVRVVLINDSLTRAWTVLVTPPAPGGAAALERLRAPSRVLNHGCHARRTELRPAHRHRVAAGPRAGALIVPRARCLPCANACGERRDTDNLAERGLAVSVGRYVLGLAALICVIGSLAAGATALRAALVPTWRGAPARLAEAVSALFLLVLTAQLLGAVGLLRLAPIVIASVVVGFGIRLWLGPLRAEAERAGARRRRLARGLIMLPAVLAVGVVLAEWAGPTLQAYGQGILGADSVSYHLPWAASFAQTGQVTAIRYTDIQYLTGFYPATSELLHAVGIVLMGNDVLSPALNFLWLALVLLAAWCVGALRGVGSASLLGGAVVMAAPLMFFSTAGSADSDGAAVFFLVAAVALWLSSSSDDEHRWGRGGLCLSALAAGLAISVKLNLLLPVALMTVGVPFAAPRGRRRATAGVWAGGVFVAGGFWYLRNLIAVGNPLPYFTFGFLPTPQPPPLQGATNYSIASYLGHGHILGSVFAPALAQGLGRWWAVIVAAAVLGGGLCVAFGRGRAVRIAGLLAILSLAAYVVTPGSASGPWGNPKGFYFNLRYGAPALAVALALAPLAWPLTRRYARWLVLGGLGAAFIATIARKELWAPNYTIGADIAAALVVLAAGAIVLLIPWSRTRAASLVTRVAAATAIAALVLAGAAAGYGREKHYLAVRYSKEPSLKPVARLWRWTKTVHDQRIAFGGTFGWYFGYPLYGSDASNHVAYLGHRGAHGSFVAIRSCQEWRRVIDAGRYRYIVTSGSRAMWTGAVTPSPETAWTRADPAVERVSPRDASNWALEIYW